MQITDTIAAKSAVDPTHTFVNSVFAVSASESSLTRARFPELRRQAGKIA